ncbi:MAG TPA: DUF6807 family protein [Planctomycetota bacterium]|nr:DUF6807 family protein [Planctomycetota bacterium]
MTLRVEIVPEKAIVIHRDRAIVAASWFGAGTLRPYIYPFLGPDDREVTRLGHPNDPVGHSHHRGIWIGHHDVAGTSFWEDAAEGGRIDQIDVRVEAKEGDEVSVVLACAWKTAGSQALLLEKRGLRFIDLGKGELALEIDMTIRPAGKEAVTLGATPFGLLGIRVARTMRVAEGLGGKILNSNEAENEKGCFWQHADWCDYSGPVPLSGPGEDRAAEASAPVRLPGAIVGVSCFTHPGNSSEDTLWHVRDDGWMGPSISKSAPRVIPAGDSLRARYRVEAHAGGAADARVGDRYRVWRKKAE